MQCAVMNCQPRPMQNKLGSAGQAPYCLVLSEKRAKYRYRRQNGVPDPTHDYHGVTRRLGHRTRLSPGEADAVDAGMGRRRDKRVQCRI